MNEGHAIPACEIVATNNITTNLDNYRGQWLILYFYPKDSTPGCTTEAQDFRDNYPLFKNLDSEIFGISRDSLKSHENFKAKQNLPFELISDEDEHLCQLFDVINMKNMYGKEVRGIERSTFIIDPAGKIAHQWRKVKVKDHIKEVFAALQELQN
jgi:peroxiredoxin Q/BCP